MWPSVLRDRFDARARRARREVPALPGPAGLPLLGSLRALQRDRLAFFVDAAAYGPIAHYRLGPFDFYQLNEPEDVERVLLLGTGPVRKDHGTRLLNRLLGEGLLTSDGAVWRAQRRLVQHAFTPRRIRGHVARMIDAANVEVARWREGETLDVYAMFGRLTLDVVGRTLFGGDVLDKAQEIGDAMAYVSSFYVERIESPWPAPEWLPSPANRRFHDALGTIESVLNGLIEDRRRSGEARDDLLGSLLDARDERRQPMSARQLRDECMTLFLAGHETTAIALTYTFYALSKHGAVRRRLVDEIDHVLEGRAPSMDDLPRLEHGARVLKEAMRLYPPAYAIGRELCEPLALRGHTLPVGAQVVMCQWSMHRDPRFFPQPEAFDPERWAEGRADALPRYAYFPFGGGPRVCVGFQFALTEAQLVMTTIAQRAHLELLPGETLSFAPAVTLRPARPVRMRVRRRAVGG
ncbi:MAG: cytochrome P450 [Myxococcales bacterium]|nr:cytochrome P450 [Myxococcales bacterium]